MHNIYIRISGIYKYFYDSYPIANIINETILYVTLLNCKLTKIFLSA